MLTTKLLSILCALSFPIAIQAASVHVTNCTSIGKALQITPYCVDPEFNAPIIDTESNELRPAPHYRVSGHFANTTIKFNYYLPLKSENTTTKWEGRFYHSVYPDQAATANENTIGNGLASGAYVIQNTGTQGYRANAAAARFSRAVAAKYYGLNDTTHIFGYVYGLSGGSLQVIGGLENTEGIWDGGVPIVQAIPAGISISQSVRAMAGLVLQNQSLAIEAALKPGGSADPYAGLNRVQHDILREVVQVGLPIAVLEDFYYAMNRTQLAQLRVSFVGVDPAYTSDFWTEKGYLGSEQSPLGDLFRSAVVEFNASVLGIEKDAQGVPTVRLADIAHRQGFDLDWDGIGYWFSVTAPNGTNLGGVAGRLNHSTATATFSHPENNTNDASLYDYIQPNSTLVISNKDFIALSAFYRYQVPNLADNRGFLGYNVLRDANGSSLYPQRPLNLPSALSNGASGGGNQTGLIRSKAIFIQDLLDQHAFPWWAHWYRQQVRSSLGEQYEDSYRLWYNSYMTHDAGQPPNTDLFVDYRGVYERALRALSAWVEKSTLPPLTSNYTLMYDNDISLPEDASQRRGVQPTVSVSLSPNGTMQTSSGTSLSFVVTAEVPPGAGKIVSLEWDFLGNRNFVDGGVLEFSEAVTSRKQFTYEQPGSYTIVVRATSQEENTIGSPYGKVMNLGRFNIAVT